MYSVCSSIICLFLGEVTGYCTVNPRLTTVGRIRDGQAVSGGEGQKPPKLPLRKTGGRAVSGGLFAFLDKQANEVIVHVFDSSSSSSIVRECNFTNIHTYVHAYIRDIRYPHQMLVCAEQRHRRGFIFG